MLKPDGYVKITEGLPRLGGDVIAEADSFRCNHCGAIRMVKAGANLDDLGNMCPGCMKMICPTCTNRARTHGCVTIERNLEREEARHQALRSYGLA